MPYEFDWVEMASVLGPLLMLMGSLLGFVGAYAKRRDPTWWMVYGFLFPPSVILLIFMRRNKKRPPRHHDEGEGDGMGSFILP